MAGYDQADHFEIAGIAVDRRALTLTGANGESRVEPKVMDLLCALAETPGRVWTRGELIDRVWGVTFGGDESLTRAVSLLRKAFRAPHDVTDVIETVAKSGYVLKAGVGQSRNGKRLDNIDLPDPANGTVTLAVLAFETEADDGEMRLFADGVSEDILHAVCRIDGARVIARSSSFQLRGPDKAPQRVAAELGATHLIDGTIRDLGQTAKVRLELVEVAGRTVIWSSLFETGLGELPDVSETVAEAVASTLQLSFVRRNQRVAKAEAMSLYLKARALIGPEETNRTAVTLLEAALACDSELAPAWSLLAYANGVAFRWQKRNAPVAVLAANIREAAETGLRLDPSSATAHLALGLLEPLGDYAARERQLAHALALSPNDISALNQQSMFEFSNGYIRKAFRVAAKAHQIDPLNLNVCLAYLDLLAEIGLVKESDEVAFNADLRWPGHWWILGTSALRAASCGDWKSADALMSAAEAAPMDGFEMVRFAVSALRNPDAGHRALIRERCEEQMQRRGRVQPSTLVLAYNVGLADEVFSLVDRSDFSCLFRIDGEPLEPRGFSLGVLFSVANARMRRDVRFPLLCAKLGLATYWRESGNWPDCAEDRLPYDFKAECAHAAESMPI